MNKEERNKALLDLQHSLIMDRIVTTKLIEYLGLTTSIEGLPESWDYKDFAEHLKIVKKEEVNDKKE